jgi:hypothetical protein
MARTPMALIAEYWKARFYMLSLGIISTPYCANHHTALRSVLTETVTLFTIYDVTLA